MSAISDSSEPVRVLVVDRHPVIRRVVRLACESSNRLEVVGEAGGADEAAQACSRLRPDIVVIDVDLDGNGIAAIRTMHEDGFAGRILVMTEQMSPGVVLECLRAGVDGYIEKVQGLRTVGSSILRVALGERLIGPDLQEAAVLELGRFALAAREGHKVASSLTAREMEVLRFISEGLTVSGVAKRMGISPRTVETHLAKLYRKLGARTRVQAVSRAASLGLIDLGYRSTDS